MKHTIPNFKESTLLGNKFKASILRLGVFLASMLLSNGLLAQITYSQNFTALTHGWTGGFRSTIAGSACTATDGHYRSNLYSFNMDDQYTSPTIGTSNGGVVTLGYDYKVTNWGSYAATPNTFGSLKWEYQVAGGTWQTVSSSLISTDHVPATTCATKSISFALPPGANVKVRLNVTWGLGDYYVTLDNVTVTQGAAPTCLQPGTPVISNLTNSMAKLTWTAQSANPTGTSYEYEVRSAGAAGSGASSLAASGTTSNLNVFATALSGNTPYVAYVRALCGGGDNSSWASTAFTTACNPIMAPFTEGFESATTSACPCWTQQSTVGTQVWTFATGDGAFSGGITTAHGGTKNARYVSSSISSATILVSPMVDITTLSNPRVEFWYGQVEDFGDQNELKVYYRTHPLSQWVLLADYPNEATAWTVARLPIPGTAISPTFQIGFEGINNWGKRNVLDDVIIEETPSCFSPQVANLTFASITDVSAIANWLTNPDGAPIDYEIEVRLAGTAQGSATGLAFQDTVSSSVLTSTMSNLASNTLYTFYIRALCATSQGTWTAKDFRTKCAPGTLPIQEDFFTWTPDPATSTSAKVGTYDPCYSIDYIAPSTATTNTYLWYRRSNTFSLFGGPSGLPPGTPPTTQYLFVNGSFGSATSTAQQPGSAAVLSLPVFNANGYVKLEMDQVVNMATPSTTTFFDSKFYVEREVNGAWVKLDSMSLVGPNWTNYSTGWNATGLESVRLRAIRGIGNYNVWAIANLSVVSDPCPVPTALIDDTVTSHTATVSWSSAVPTTASYVVWGPVGFVPGTGANGGNWSASATSPFTISGLTGNSQYHVYVMDSCSGGLGSLAGPLAISTLLPERDLALHAIYNDLGNCGDSNSAVIVAVRNRGLLPASGYTVTLDVTDPNTGSVIPLTASSSAVVAPGAIDSVVLGTYNSILGGSFGLSASVTSNRDTVSSNDSLAINYSYLPSTPALLPVRTFCSNAGMVYVAAQPYPGTVIRWFSDPAGTQLVGEGDSIMVDVNGPSTYYATYVPKPIVSVGSGSLSTTTSGLTPFTSFYEDSRSRVMILASELTALGLSAGNVTDLAIEVTSLGGQPIENFNIQMWDTSSTSVGNLNDPAPSSAHVFYTDTLVAPVVGKNTFSGTPFYWNGQDNLVIQFCHDADDYTFPNYGVAYSVASFQASTYAAMDNGVGCTSTFSFPSTSANRINIDITIPAAPCVNAVTAAVSFVKDTINVADAQFTTAWLNSFQYQFDGTASFADQHTWDFGDGYTNSTTLTPIHTFATSGTYDVTLTVYESACGSWDTLTQQVSYFIGTDELGISAAAFPNPTTGVVNIVANNMGEFTGVLKVYNVLGQLITESKVSAANGDLNHKLDLSGLAKGLYTIVLTNEEKTANLRVVLQ